MILLFLDQICFVFSKGITSLRNSYIWNWVTCGSHGLSKFIVCHPYFFEFFLGSCIRPQLTIFCLVIYVSKLVWESKPSHSWARST